MRDVRDLNFGFATFDQDGLHINRKHFWYRVAPVAQQPSGLIPLGSTGRFYPEAGQEDLFGQNWPCTFFGKDATGVHEADYSQIGCNKANPADLNDHWEWERVRRWPKLDEDGKAIPVASIFYVRTSGRAFRVKYNPTNVPHGAARITVNVEVRECTAGSNADCSNGPVQGTKNIDFDRVAKLIYWEPGEGIRRQPQGCTDGGPFDGTCPPSSVFAFFGSGGTEPARPRQLTGVGGTANGWDGNDVTDEANDVFSGQNLRQPTVADPFGRGAAFSVGDVIPFDWRPEARRNRERIALRMAPNLENEANPLTPSISPDFTVENYFEDHPPVLGAPTAGSVLRLLDSTQRPIISEGGTPTGHAMNAFRTWFTAWRAVASSPSGDPDFNCRKIYLLVLTDGLANDSPTTRACTEATSLRLMGVKSFAVGFGYDDTAVPGRTNVLPCIADNGATGAIDHDGDGQPDGPGPLLPQDKDDLVETLIDIFKFIRADSRSFASAAVPSVQVESQDKIYLTSFNPVSGGSYWPGRIDAYLKPVPPVTVNGRTIANRDRVCTASDEGGCRLWDAGFNMLVQAPTPAELAGASPRYRIGNADDERRVFYSQDLGLVPRTRKLFLPPASAGDLTDLRTAMNIPAATAAAEVRDVIKETLVQKPATIIDPISNNPRNIQFVLGDVFHSDPLIIGTPNRFRYFAANLGATDPNAACTNVAGRNGYRCFVRQHEFRRKMLLLGSNDGQFHAFDAGLAFRINEGGEDKVVFDNGTGKELFAVHPAQQPAGLEAPERRRRPRADRRRLAAGRRRLHRPGSQRHPDRHRSRVADGGALRHA